MWELAPELLDAVFGASPGGWLPSFQPTTPDWYVGAYLRVIPAIAGVTALAWLGSRPDRITRAFGASSLDNGRARRCKGSSKILAHTRSNGARRR